MFQRSRLHPEPGGGGGDEPSWWWTFLPRSKSLPHSALNWRGQRWVRLSSPPGLASAVIWGSEADVLAFFIQILLTISRAQAGSRTLTWDEWIKHTWWPLLEIKWNNTQKYYYTFTNQFMNILWVQKPVMPTKEKCFRSRKLQQNKTCFSKQNKMFCFMITSCAV